MQKALIFLYLFNNSKFPQSSPQKKLQKLYDKQKSVLLDIQT